MLFVLLLFCMTLSFYTSCRIKIFEPSFIVIQNPDRLNRLGRMRGWKEVQGVNTAPIIGDAGKRNGSCFLVLLRIMEQLPRM
jgi:hypothetical protein